MIIITNCTNYFRINTSYPNMTNENDNSTGNNCCIQQQNIDVTQRYHSDLQDSTAIALNITYSTICLNQRNFCFIIPKGSCVIFRGDMNSNPHADQYLYNNSDEDKEYENH